MATHSLMYITGGLSENVARVDKDCSTLRLYPHLVMEVSVSSVMLIYLLPK